MTKWCHFWITMSKNYTQLSLCQRYQIEALYKQGTLQKEIASLVGVHPSTVSRELKRNIPMQGKYKEQYIAARAQTRTDERHRDKPKKVIFTEEHKQWARQKIMEEGWSPELVSALGHRTGCCPISHEWLYRWIWDCKHGWRRRNEPYKEIWTKLRFARRHLRRGTKKRSGKLQIPDRVCITHRPSVVLERKRLGDLEIDLMFGDRSKKGAVLVILDRATLHSQLVKLQDKNSTDLIRKAYQRLKTLPFKLRTITMDNDNAFILHTQLKDKLEVKTYFTRPYTSQDKGSVENRIGVLRRFIPKKADLSVVTESVLEEIQEKLNNRPVKKFNYLTPNQVLLKKLH